MSGLGGVSAHGGGVSALGGVCSGGSASGGGYASDTTPVNRMTDRCKNITLATTSLRPVIKIYLAFDIDGANGQLP